MRKPKPTTRVVGIYKHDSGRWRIVTMVEGKQKVEYRRNKEAAQARANEIRANLGHEVVDYGQQPINVEWGGGLTKGEWISAMWQQVRSVQELTDPNLRVQAVDVIAKAYKSIREDLEALSGGAKLEDPAAMSDEELQKKIAQLSEITDAARPAGSN